MRPHRTALFAYKSAWVVLCCGLFTISFILGVVGMTTSGCNSPANKRTGDWPRADYDDPDLAFWGGPEYVVNQEMAFGQLTSGGGQDAVAPIYIRIEGEGVHFLPDLPEAVVAEYFPIRPVPNKKIDSYSDLTSSFSYQDGQLIMVSVDMYPGLPLHRGDKPPFKFAFSRTADGPFMEFPATRAQIVEYFGEPDKWTWYTSRGP